MIDSEIERLLNTILDEVRTIKKELREHSIGQPPSDPLNEPAAGAIDREIDLRKYVATFECPTCQGEMKLRKRRSDGQYFMGCSNYPDCTGLRDMDGLEKTRIY